MQMFLDWTVLYDDIMCGKEQLDLALRLNYSPEATLLIWWKVKEVAKLFTISSKHK